MFVDCQGENYNYRDALVLSHYDVEELPAKEKDRVCFYPRDAMLARVIAIATCLSVRLSVRFPRAGIVSKRRKLAA